MTKEQEILESWTADYITDEAVEFYEKGKVSIILSEYAQTVKNLSLNPPVSGSLPADLRRKIEIHIETTEECIENFGIPKYVKELLEQDIELYRLILARC